MISIIITTYKREVGILQRAIKSVLAQTYKELELIVVDDSPATYAHREAIRKYVTSISEIPTLYIQHERNMGACIARNTGIDNSSGEYIAFLDDDDEWLPQKLEKQLQMFREDVGLVYCGRLISNDETSQVYPSDVTFHNGYIFDSLIKANYIGSTSFPLIKRDVLCKIGKFDPEMKSAQDYDVWLRVAQKYRIEYVSEPLVIYHVHSGEQISKNAKNVICGLERLNNKNFDYLKAHKQILGLRIMKITPYYAVFNKRQAITVWFKSAFMRPACVKSNVYYLAQILLAKKQTSR